MNCPECGASAGEGNGKVLETRHVFDKQAIRRRRECQTCKARWTTFEIIPEFFSQMESDAVGDIESALEELKQLSDRISQYRIVTTKSWLERYNQPAESWADRYTEPTSESPISGDAL